MTGRDGEGDDQPFPRGAIYGPKVMIINERAGSGGDYLPYTFRQAQLGPLVGKRTWGGLVGIGGYPTLIDGGSVTAPRMGIWFPSSSTSTGPTTGRWDVENRGVPPDVEVEFDPQAVREGRDPQLEKAVELVLAELKKQPFKIAKIERKERRKFPLAPLNCPVPPATTSVSVPENGNDGLGWHAPWQFRLLGVSCRVIDPPARVMVPGSVRTTFVAPVAPARVVANAVFAPITLLARV